MQDVKPIEAKHRALLVIDMQVGLLHGPEKPYEATQLVEHINQLIARARAAKAPIFAVRHTGPAGSPIAAGSPLWQIAPEIAIDEKHDIIFNKAKPSSFIDTQLAAQLKAANIAELVIVGMKTQYCIDTNCRAAAEHGFQPILVSDAHSCMDTPSLSAKAIIDHHNLTLSGPIAKLETTASCVFAKSPSAVMQ